MYPNCPRAISLQYVQYHHEKESRIKIAVKERADQPVHPHRHINTFSACYIDSILHLYNRICNHWLAMAAQAGRLVFHQVGTPTSGFHKYIYKCKYSGLRECIYVYVKTTPYQHAEERREASRESPPSREDSDG